MPPLSDLTSFFSIIKQRSKPPVPRRCRSASPLPSCDDISEQPIETGCDLLLSRLLAEPTSDPFCAISGGEFSCPVRGDGRGGRNLETVLRCAIRLDESKINNGQHFVILSAGTDGIDGNSPAAGAIADETTINAPVSSVSTPTNISPAATLTASSNG